MNLISRIVAMAMAFGSSKDSQLQHKKYLLHFDVNKTILADDPAGGKTLHDILIHSLADRYKACWGSKITKPICYADYIKIYILPGRSDDRELKKLRVKKISEFVEYLKENNHPIYLEVKETLENLKYRISQQKGDIFESFYNLINYLKQNSIDYTIIIRTFGDDIDRVAHELNGQIAPDFMKSFGKIQNRTLHINGAPERKFTAPQEIYNFFKTTGHIALQDAWKEWSLHNEHQHYGKLFPIDLEDPEIVSIFFDDNVIDDPESFSNIVDPVDAKTGKHLPVCELIKNKNIFVVDTIAAILDSNYFIKLLESAKSS